MRVQMRRWLRAMGWVVVLCAVVACESVFYADPAPAPSTLELHLLPVTGSATATPEMGDAGPFGAADEPARTSHGAGNAFDRVDGVRVRLETETGDLLDRVFSADPAAGEIRLTVPVELEDAVVSAFLELELRMGEAALFRGGTELTLRRGSRTQAEVALEGVAAELALPPPPAPLEALGDTVELTGFALFATGDTIPQAALSWSSLDPEVVEVSTDGIAIALSEGEAQIEATFQALSETVRVTVAQVVVEVDVFPPEAELAPGETLQLEAQPRDRRGNLVQGRAASWSSSAPDVATVSAEGLVQGLSPGSAEITAEVEGLEGTAEVTVAPAPPEVETLAPDEVEPEGARFRARVNPRGVPVDVVFRYGTDPSLIESAETSPVSVAAGVDPVLLFRTVANLQQETTYYVQARASGPSGAQNGSTVEFTTPVRPPPPDDLSANFEPDEGGGTVHLRWFFPFEEFEHPVEFRIERAYDADGVPGTWAQIATTTETQYEDPNPGVAGNRYHYRVRACHESFCSAYSNEASDVVFAPPQPPDPE